MHSPTLANDFSSRSTLVSAPFQPLLSRCARCLPSKSRVLTLLRTLLLSLHSFRRSPGLFSIICRLFLQNTGGVGTSATSPRSLRLPVLHAGLPVLRAGLCIIICHFFVAPLFSWSYKLLFPQALYFDNHLRCPPGCGVRAPLPTLPIVFNSSHQLRLRGKFSFCASACYRPHLQGGLCPLTK
jgi:hypothetical protein